MSLVKHIYLMATITIASLFLGMYIYSGLEFCLVPVFLVLLDYVRVIKGGRWFNYGREERIRERRERVTQPFNMVTWSVEFEKEFIKEEEFKV